MTIVRITEEGEQIPVMLAFCSEHGLQPGANFRIHAKDENAVHLQRPLLSDESKAESNVTLPLRLAKHIRYEIIVKMS